MGAQVRDDVDALAVEWAPVRRELLGLSNPKRARDYLGAPRCTLSNVRTHWDGAGSRTQREQHVPEVHTPQGLRFARAFAFLRPEARHVLDVHYCVAMPASLKADLLGMSRRDYYFKLDGAKNYIRGVLAVLEAGRDRAA